MACDNTLKFKKQQWGWREEYYAKEGQYNSKEVKLIEFVE